jgi:hypothetical protein
MRRNKMEVYRLVNTKNGYTIGVFSTEEKANDAFDLLRGSLGAMNMIIYREELDHIYSENARR